MKRSVVDRKNRQAGIFLISMLVQICFIVGCFNLKDVLAAEIARIDFYDGNEITYSFLTDQNIGETFVIPGLPDDIRKEDSIFSYFCINANGEGEKYYPGDKIILNDVCTNLFIIWESAVIYGMDIKTTRTFVQEFQKTNMTPKSFSIQGGTLAVRNGKKYWIQACAREVSEDAKERHSVDEAMNYTAIFIYDYESGEIINSVFNIPFGHGNDLEYNPDLDKIIICSALEEGETITEVTWDLTEYTCFSPDGTKGFRTVDCAYDSTDRVYVLTLAPLNSNYLKDSVLVLHYDENWQLQNKMESPFSIPENHYGFQGACIYKGYYYLVNFLKDNLLEAGNTSFKYARVSIYDCDTMSYVGSFPVNVSDEI